MSRRTMSVMMMAVLAVGALAFAPASPAASAGGYPPPPPAEPPVVVHTLPPAPPGVQATQAQVSDQRTSRVVGIALTGANLLRLAWFALILVAVGAVLLVANRRRGRLHATGTRR